MEFYHITNRQLSPVNPLRAGYHYCASSYAYGFSARHGWLIHYVVSGQGVFRKNNAEYKLTPGMCFIVNPDDMAYYKADANNPWHYIWIGFTSSFALSKCIAESAVLYAEPACKAFLELEEKYSYYNGFDGDNGIREAYLCGKIVEILTILGILHNPNAQTKAQNFAYVAQNYIDSEFASSITVAGLAKRFHHDRTYFSRMFKKNVGVPPQEYINQKRLAEGARLLSECGFTLTDAARSVGYSDICAFSKMFKKKYGISPGTLKKSKQSAIHN